MFSCSKKEVLSRLHFSPVPVFHLGNWIPQVFYYWGSVARNYVLAQVSFTFNGKWCIFEAHSEEMYFVVCCLVILLCKLSK